MTSLQVGCLRVALSLEATAVAVVPIRLRQYTASLMPPTMMATRSPSVSTPPLTSSGNKDSGVPALNFHNDDGLHSHRPASCIRSYHSADFVYISI